MKKTVGLLRVVGVIQIALGAFYLFAPGFLLESLGHTLPEADIFYPLAMLAARFIGYGAALLYVSGRPAQHRLWMYFMVLIQAIDLGAGIFYTATGVVTLALSGFAMFNATWIIVLLLLWMPKKQ
jgi:hypothetical protein